MKSMHTISWQVVFATAAFFTFGSVQRSNKTSKSTQVLKITTISFMVAYFGCLQMKSMCTISWQVYFVHSRVILNVKGSSKRDSDHLECFEKKSHKFYEQKYGPIYLYIFQLKMGPLVRDLLCIIILLGFPLSWDRTA